MSKVIEAIYFPFSSKISSRLNLRSCSVSQYLQVAILLNFILVSIQTKNNHSFEIFLIFEIQLGGIVRHILKNFFQPQFSSIFDLDFIRRDCPCCASIVVPFSKILNKFGIPLNTFFFLLKRLKNNQFLKTNILPSA